jgi:hypothetical protein
MSRWQLLISDGPTGRVPVAHAAVADIGGAHLEFVFVKFTFGGEHVSNAGRATAANRIEHIQSQSFSAQERGTKLASCRAKDLQQNLRV